MEYYLNELKAEVEELSKKENINIQKSNDEEKDNDVNIKEELNNEKVKLIGSILLYQEINKKSYKNDLNQQNDIIVTENNYEENDYDFYYVKFLNNIINIIYMLRIKQKRS